MERQEGLVDALVDFLSGIDGRGYKAYKGLRGSWTFPDFALYVDHVQGDPFAAPSRVRVILPPKTAALDDEVLRSRSRRLGVASLLAKRFHEAALGTTVRRGSGDYLDVADTVVAMREFRPSDVTADALRVALDFPTGRNQESPEPIKEFQERLPNPTSVDPSTRKRDVEIKVFKGGSLVFGTERIDLSAITQLVSNAQTVAVGRGLLMARNRFMDGRRSVSQILTLVMETIEEKGLDELDDRRVGDLAQFRPMELAAALNRLRTLEVQSVGHASV
jgi:predicted ABC-class ATPase